jgi:hypothetical protein
MALYPVGVPAFDAAARSAQAIRDAAEAQPNLTQAQATAAAKIYFQSIVAAGAANGVATINDCARLGCTNKNVATANAPNSLIWITSQVRGHTSTEWRVPC